MKKLSFATLIATLLFNVSFSQENKTLNTSETNFNEIKLNGLFLIAGALEVTYERTLTDESGVGITVFLPIDDDISDDINYFVSPYYRFYFGKKYAAGFYVEGFGMLNSTNDFTFTSNNNNFFETNDGADLSSFAAPIGLVNRKKLFNEGFEIEFDSDNPKLASIGHDRERALIGLALQIASHINSQHGETGVTAVSAIGFNARSREEEVVNRFTGRPSHFHQTGSFAKVINGNISLSQEVFGAGRSFSDLVRTVIHEQLHEGTFAHITELIKTNPVEYERIHRGPFVDEVNRRARSGGIR